MPYITKEQVALKRKQIKKQFPDFKFSIRNENYSKISVTILEGPVAMTDREDGYEHVNVFSIGRVYENKPTVKSVLEGIYSIINRDNYTESFDGDYGNIPSFYTRIAIGDWDRPYICK